MRPYKLLHKEAIKQKTLLSTTLTRPHHPGHYTQSLSGGPTTCLSSLHTHSATSTSLLLLQNRKRLPTSNAAATATATASPRKLHPHQHKRHFFFSRKSPDPEYDDEAENPALIDVDVTTATAEDTVPGAPVLKRLVRYLDDKIGNAPSEEALLDGFDRLVGSYLDSKGEMKRERELLEEHTHALMTAYEYLVRRKLLEAELEVEREKEEVKRQQQESRVGEEDAVKGEEGEEKWKVLLRAVETEPVDPPPAIVVTSPLSIETLKKTLKVIHSSPTTTATLEFAKLLFYDLMSRPDTSFEIIRNALMAAAYAAQNKDEVKLARMLFTDMIHREGYVPHRDDYLALVHALGVNGDADHALKICQAAFHAYGTQAIDEVVWQELLAGYVKFGSEDSEEGISAAWKAAVEDAGVKPTAGMYHQRIAFHCAKRDGVPDARLWWIQLKTSNLEPELRTYELLLAAYARARRKTVADELLWYLLTKLSMPESNRTPKEVAERKAWWGGALRWAGTIGVGLLHRGIRPGLPSVDYVFKWMINARENEGKTWVPMPDTELLNMVLEMAVEKGKFDLAAGLVDELAPQYGILPDWKTLALQTRMYIQRNELAPAQDAYEKMKRQKRPLDVIEKQQRQEDDATELLALIYAQCTRNAPYPKVRYLLDDLKERGVALPPPTIIHLVAYFLRTSHLSHIRPLLTDVLPTLSPQWKQQLVNAFTEHITAVNTSTALNTAWNAYLLLHHHFTPLGCIPTSTLIEIMNAFFYTHGRSDMATTVLTHVHTSSIIGGEGGVGEPVPVEMYIACFNGLAQAGDITNLSLVHSLLNLSPHLTVSTKTSSPSSSSNLGKGNLKTTTTISTPEGAIETLENHHNQTAHLKEPTTTPLLNSLLGAYTTLGHHTRAFALWNTIRRSRSGPDHETISLALRLFGLRSGWIFRAHELWRQLDSFGITPTQDNYARYVEAIMVSGDFARAFGVVKKMEAVDGVQPSVTVLSMLYNTAPVEKRPEVVEWASQAYPAVFLPWFNRGLQTVNARRL